jgi:hypothetical protein
VKVVGGGIRGPGGAAIGGGRVKIEGPGGRSTTIRGGGARGPYGGAVGGGSVKYSGPGGEVKMRGGAVRGPGGGVVAGGSVKAGAGTLYTLPAGYRTVVIRGTRYYHWGSYYYQPVYRGGSLVYVRVEVR